MGGVYSYDESVAESAHGDIHGVMSALESSLSDLSGYVSRVKSQWEGDEQHEYAGVQNKWDTAASTVRTILTSVHQALGDNTSSVKSMRAQVRSAIHSS